MKKKFIMRIHSNLVEVYGGGQYDAVHIPEDMDAETIPLNGLAYIDKIGDREFIIGHENCGSFQALMEAE